MNTAREETIASPKETIVSFTANKKEEDVRNVQPTYNPDSEASRRLEKLREEYGVDQY